MKHNALLFLLSFTKCQPKKKILIEHYLWVQTPKKGEKQFWDYFSNISAESKK